MLNREQLPCGKTTVDLFGVFGFYSSGLLTLCYFCRNKVQLGTKAVSISKMFVLAQMKDTVRIPPHLLHLDTTQTIIGILNKKLANKVLSKDNSILTFLWEWVVLVLAEQQ